MDTPLSPADVPDPHSEPTPPQRPAPRLQRPERSRLDPFPQTIDELVPADHQVRTVWAFVEGMDLTLLYQAIKAVEGHPGRTPIDLRILVALWLYATLEGVASARQLDELCRRHDAYKWLCGGVA